VGSSRIFSGDCRLICAIFSGVFILGKPLYVLKKPEGNIVMIVFKAIWVSSCDLIYSALPVNVR